MPVEGKPRNESSSSDNSGTYINGGTLNFENDWKEWWKFQNWFLPKFSTFSWDQEALNLNTHRQVGLFFSVFLFTALGLESFTQGEILTKSALVRDSSILHHIMRYNQKCKLCQ